MECYRDFFVFYKLAIFFLSIKIFSQDFFAGTFMDMGKNGISVLQENYY